MLGGKYPQQSGNAMKMWRERQADNLLGDPRDGVENSKQPASRGSASGGADVLDLAIAAGIGAMLF